jgi:ubiquinone/menaquinone biosynthesis C-methylase UbiE
VQGARAGRTGRSDAGLVGQRPFAVKHADHLDLIRAGVTGAGPHWLELGAGNGEFTLALADLLGPTGHILALDQDRWALDELAGRVAARFPATPVHTLTADFTAGLPNGPFDGVLAANSLHFVADVEPVLAAIRSVLAPAGRLVLVEYDAEHGNPYVPHPISFRRWQLLAPAAGFADPVLTHRVPSRFLGSIYGAATTVDATGDDGPRMVDSSPHGGDREE